MCGKKHSRFHFKTSVQGSLSDQCTSFGLASRKPLANTHCSHAVASGAKQAKTQPRNSQSWELMNMWEQQEARPQSFGLDHVRPCCSVSCVYFCSSKLHKSSSYKYSAYKLIKCLQICNYAIQKLKQSVTRTNEHALKKCSVVINVIFPFKLFFYTLTFIIWTPPCNEQALGRQFHGLPREKSKFLNDMSRSPDLTDVWKLIDVC